MAAFTSQPIPGAPPDVGREILGLNLRETPSEEVLKELERQMAFYGFVVFRGQMDLSGDEQVRISE